jgi:tRNA1(Val) A37 N6-methylase TrmN6
MLLDGRVRLAQPRAGYRAGIDPVLLAASVQAERGQAVLELGCGAAPALCCLAHRVPGLRLAGLELQPAYAALARENLARNGFQGTIHEGDVAAPPRALRAEIFDHVMLNPPYFKASSRSAANRADRELALAGATPLADWIACAARRVRPRGWVHVIQRAERLPDLMAAMTADLGSLELLPLIPRAGRAPRLILMRGRKGGRAAFRFRPAVVLHARPRHESDAEDYSDAIRAVVRDGAALPIQEGNA